MPLRIRALEACTAKHGVDAVVADIGPDAMPKQLNRALIPIGRKHAGAAKLKKAQARIGRNQRGNVKLALRVESAMTCGHILPQQSIGANDLRPALAARIQGRIVDDEKVITYRIEPVRIGAQQNMAHARACRHLLIKHLEAQALRAPQIKRAPRQPDLEITAPAKHSRQAILAGGQARTWQEWQGTGLARHAETKLVPETR